MELAKDDNLTLLQADPASGQQRFAVHAPLPKHWQGGVNFDRGSGGTVVPELIVASTGSFVTLHWNKHDPLETLLQRIETAFGITRNELAKVCNTTRKTVYNWLNGDAEPQEKNRDRLFALELLATDWADAGYTADRSLLRTPIVDGRSVIELLCEDPIDSDLVLFAGSRITMNSQSSMLTDPFST